MKQLLSLLLLVTACCSSEQQTLMREAQTHALKVRNHFMGYVSEDLSTLIAETQIMAQRLKAMKMDQLANKFNSYTDVLMYGNKTLAESVRDMQELVSKGICTCEYKKCIDNPFNR